MVSYKFLEGFIKVFMSLLTRCHENFSKEVPNMLWEEVYPACMGRFWALNSVRKGPIWQIFLHYGCVWLKPAAIV